VPTEPPRTGWVFPDPTDAEDDLVGLGADLEPGTLLAAYRCGMFPMPADEPGAPMLWWSPQHRGVLPLEGLRVSRSLRQSARGMEIRVDSAFDEVIEACADPSREAGWIDESILEAYTRLHALGWAHSVEAWRDGELVGGLYGVAIGGLFAGESMFHFRTDASKAALVGLVRLLTDGADDLGDRVLDVQWMTPHLASLGAVDLDRADYVRRVAEAVRLPLPPGFRL
jgi:leucyl/phenylalanyl-tRNA--protein transferase